MFHRHTHTVRLTVFALIMAALLAVWMAASLAH